MGILKVLNNVRSLRVLARETSLEQLEVVLGKLQLVVEEKRQEEALIRQQEAERLERIEKYRELLKQEGINPAELAKLEVITKKAKKPRAKRAPLPAKYKYTDAQGNIKTWTGQGRTPLVIQAALNAGKSLKDFKI